MVWRAAHTIAIAYCTTQRDDNLKVEVGRRFGRVIRDASCRLRLLVKEGDFYINSYNWSWSWSWSWRARWLLLLLFFAGPIDITDDSPSGAWWWWRVCIVDWRCHCRCCRCCRCCLCCCWMLDSIMMLMVDVDVGVRVRVGSCVALTVDGWRTQANARTHKIILLENTYLLLERTGRFISPKLCIQRTHGLVVQITNRTTPSIKCGTTRPWARWIHSFGLTVRASERAMYVVRVDLGKIRTYASNCRSLFWCLFSFVRVILDTVPPLESKFTCARH